MTPDQLEHRFAADGICKGGVLLLPAASALNLINEAEQHGIPIVGVDQFVLDGELTRSSLDDLDLSAGEPSANSWRDARAFIAARLEAATHFEVVLGNRMNVAAPPQPLWQRIANWDFAFQLLVLGFVGAALVVVLAARACS